MWVGRVWILLFSSETAKLRKIEVCFPNYEHVGSSVDYNYRRCITLSKLYALVNYQNFLLPISSVSFLLVKSSSAFFVDESKCKVPYPSPTFFVNNQLINLHSLFINHNGPIIYYWIYLNHIINKIKYDCCCIF